MTRYNLRPSVNVVNFQKSEASEVLHLIEIMQNHNSSVTVGFHITDPKNSNPLDFSESLFSIPYQTVKAEFLGSTGGDDKDKLVVYVGETEFGFDLSDVTFHKYISEYRIEIMAESKFYTVEFESGDIDFDGIEAARGYKSVEDQSPPEILTDGDMYNATLLICAGLSNGKYDHVEATARIFSAFADYMLKIMQEGQGDLQ